MNRNLFKLTTEEFEFLVMTQDTNSILGYEIANEEWDTKRLEKCAVKLKAKGYLIENEEKQARVVEALRTRMFVIAHSKGFFKTENGEEQLIFYFYDEGIVSVQLKDGQVELMMIPFVNLAIGQFSGVIKESYRKWRFTWQTETEENGNEYIPGEEETYMDVVHSMTRILVPIHGNAMKERVK